MQKDLVQIITDNPGCIAIVDNDFWELLSEEPTNAPEDDDKYDEWKERVTLATSNDRLVQRGSGYGSGNCYGGDILQALAVIVGIKIESV